ncbi:TetR/AcrR family transcriptional regulator [soil metagenome]
MGTRSDSAAATRRALLDAAGALLDEGGLDAVTLRAVGARAGVSRGAPYGHFADKEDLLAELAVMRWSEMTGELAALRADAALSSRERVLGALMATVDVARHQPHLYALMFRQPSHDPERLIAAAAESQDEFLAIVAELVGEAAARSSGALLLSTTHGIVGMELSGQLSVAKWGTDAIGLLQMQVDLIDR